MSGQGGSAPLFIKKRCDHFWRRGKEAETQRKNEAHKHR